MAPGAKIPTRLQRVGSKSGLTRPGSKTGLVVTGLSYDRTSSSGGLSSRHGGGVLPTTYPPPTSTGSGSGGRGGGGGRYGSPHRHGSGSGSGRWGSVCPSGATRMLAPVLLASLLSSLVTYYIILTHPTYGKPDSMPLSAMSATRTGDRIDLRMGIQLQQEHPIDGAAAAVAITHLKQQHGAGHHSARPVLQPQPGLHAGQQHHQQQAAPVEPLEAVQLQPADGLAAPVPQPKPAVPAPNPSGPTVAALKAEQERIAAIISQQHLFGMDDKTKPAGPPHFGTGGRLGF
jgi:hypothetical protein